MDHVWVTVTDYGERLSDANYRRLLLTDGHVVVSERLDASGLSTAAAFWLAEEWLISGCPSPDGVPRRVPAHAEFRAAHVRVRGPNCVSQGAVDRWRSPWKGADLGRVRNVSRLRARFATCAALLPAAQARWQAEDEQDVEALLAVPDAE